MAQAEQELERRSRGGRRRRGCCAVGPSKPSACAVMCRSIGKPVPASAAAPSGLSFSRARGSRRSAPRSRDEHLDIGQQVVAEGHGLGRLQMGEAGHDGAGMLLGPGDQRPHHVLDLADSPSIASRTQSRKSAPPGRCGCAPVCSRSAGLADQLGQPRLDVHVDVFEALVPGEVPGLDLARRWRRGLRWMAASSSAAMIPTCASMAAWARLPGDILPPHLAVEADRGIDRLHDGRGTGGEAAAPLGVTGHDGCAFRTACFPPGDGSGSRPYSLGGSGAEGFAPGHRPREGPGRRQNHHPAGSMQSGKRSHRVQ